MNIKELLEARLRDYDSQIDLTPGSIAQTQVIEPVVDALSVDPLATSTREFLVQKFGEAFPNMAIARGDAISDILITACEVFLDGYRSELTQLKYASSISNIGTLADEDADALAANWFVTRKEGSRSTGIVTVTVDRALPILIDISARFTTEGGLLFEPLFTRSITEEELLSGQITTSQFSFDVFVQAAAIGSDYNIQAGEIISSTGIGNVLSVKNEDSFAGGSDQDSSLDLLTQRLPKAISERSLVTSRGIVARLDNDLSDVQRIRVVGQGDKEMLRDKVDVQAYSDFVCHGYIYVSGSLVIASCVGPSRISAGDHIIDVSGEVRYTVREVHSTLVNTSFLLIGADTVVFSIDKVSQTTAFGFSSIRPKNALLGSVLINDQVSLGGKADVYLQHKNTNTVTSNLDLNYPTSIGNKVVHVGGNIVELYPKADELTAFSALRIGDGTFYLIIKVTQEADHTRVRLNQAISISDVNVKWENYASFDFYPSRNYVKILPETDLLTFVVTGLTQTRIITTQDSTALLMPSDEIVLSDGRSFVIQSISEGEITLTSFIVDSFFSDQAIVNRNTSSLPTPISFVDSASLSTTILDRNHPLGCYVQELSSEEAPHSFGNGRVSPSFKHALKDFQARYGQNSAVSSIQTEPTGYSLYSFNEDESDGNTEFKNHRNAYSLGYKRPSASNCVITSVNEGATLANDILSGGFSTEVEFFNEMFMENTRNVFVALGDTLEGERYVPYPLEKAQKGDLLHIKSTSLRGRYIISEVVHLIVPVASGRDRFSVSRENQISSVSNDAQYRDSYESPEDGLTRPVFQKVSLCKIFGEFPRSPIQDVEKYISFGDSPLDQNSFKPLSSFVLSRALNNPSALVDAVGLAQAVQDQLNSITEGRPDCDFIVTNKDILSLLDKLTQDTLLSYEVYRPARASGTVFIEGSSVDLYQPSPSHIPLSQMLNSVSSDTAEYNVPKYTLLNVDGQTCSLDPTLGYYIYPQTDYTDWPSLSQLEPIRNQYNLEDVTTYNASATAEFDLIYTDRSVSTESVFEKPLTLSVHEERYATYYAEDDVEQFTMTWLPYTSGNVLDTTLSYTHTIDNNTYSVSLRTREELLTELSPYLDYRCLEGRTLRDTINQYTLYLQLEQVMSYIGSLNVTESITLTGSDTNTYTVSIPAYSLQYFYDARFSDLTYPTITLGGAVGGTSQANLISLSSTYGTIPSGTVVQYTQRGTTYFSTVASCSNGSLIINDTFPESDDAILGYGVLFYDTTSGACFTQPGDYIEQDGTGFASIQSEYPVYLGANTSIYIPSQADIGRNITLFGLSFNYVAKEHMYGDLNTSISDTTPQNLEELRAAIFAPVRRNMGTYTISQVDDTFTTHPFSGNQVRSRQFLALADAGADLELSEKLPKSNFVRLGYVVTEADSPSGDLGEINNLTEFRFFESVPKEYPITGYAVDGTNRLLVSTQIENTLGDIITSDLFKYSPFETDDENVYYVHTGFNKDNLYNLRSDSIVRVSNGGHVLVQSISAQSGFSAKTMKVTEYSDEGYSISTSELITARSILDDFLIRVHPRQWVRNQGTNATFSITAEYSDLVPQAQAIFDSESDRVLCADVQARDMLPCFVGVTLFYEGNPSEAIIAQRISKLIEESINLGESLTVSRLIYGLHQSGVSRVALPVRIYMVISDLNRDRQRRELTDVLEAKDVYNIEGTNRIMSIKPAPYTYSIFGAQIKVTKIQNSSTTLANGGL